jgi:hypothetical protein
MDRAGKIAQSRVTQLKRATNGLRCRVASTLNLPPLQGASLWVAIPRVETLGSTLG